MTQRELNKNITDTQLLKQAVHLPHYFSKQILISNRD